MFAVTVFVEEVHKIKVYFWLQGWISTCSSDCSSTCRTRRRGDVWNQELWLWQICIGELGLLFL